MATHVNLESIYILAVETRLQDASKDDDKGETARAEAAA